MRFVVWQLVSMRRFFVALVAATTAACGGARCPNAVFPSQDAARIHASAIAHAVRSVRAEARVERRDEQGRIRGTVFMMLARPNRVRFDAMTQFGPAAVLTSNGATFAFTDLRENRFLEGEPCAENVARMLGLPLTPEDALNLLLGRPPETGASEQEQQTICSDGRVRLSGTFGEGQATTVMEIAQGDLALPVQEQHWRAMSFEQRNAADELVLRVEWSDYREVLDAEAGRVAVLPYRIRFLYPARNADTVVRVENLAINVALEDEVFAQTTRPGLSVERVHCE